MAIDKGKMKAFAADQVREKKHTVLIVDDEELILEAMSMMLGDECNVIQARSGAEAVDVLRATRQEISLIISDQRMPGMPGVEFLTQAISLAPMAIRMMVTGYIDVLNLVAAINEAHIHTFLAKPVEYDDFLRTVRAGLEAYEEGMKPYRRIGELEQRLADL